MRTPLMGDIVTVAIIEPVNVAAGSEMKARHRVVEVPAVVTAVIGPVEDSEAWTIGATTFKASDHNHEHIYASITLYQTADDGRAIENSMPAFAYVRPETVDTLPDDDA